MECKIAGHLFFSHSSGKTSRGPTHCQRCAESYRMGWLGRRASLQLLNSLCTNGAPGDRGHPAGFTVPNTLQQGKTQSSQAEWTDCFNYSKPHTLDCPLTCVGERSGKWRLVLEHQGPSHSHTNLYTIWVPKTAHSQLPQLLSNSN